MIYEGKLIKRGGEVKYLSPVSETEYSAFKDSIPEGMKVQVYMEVMDGSNTLAQLAKVHAMIKSLSIHTGMDFEAIKSLIKYKSGLCLTRTIEGKEFMDCKSFGDCSKEELTLAIEACYKLAEDTNLKLI